MRRIGFLLAVVMAAAPLAAPSVAHADWDVKRDPFDLQVGARYKGVLRANPHDAGALAKLLAMYRANRTVDLLRDEYAKVIEKAPSDWSALVVLGHIYRKTGDDPRALEMWTRAVAAKETDTATWLAIG